MWQGSALQDVPHVRHVHAGSLGAAGGRLAELAEKCASEPCGSALRVAGLTGIALYTQP